jgi:hypothetical protein
MGCYKEDYISAAANVTVISDWIEVDAYVYPDFVPINGVVPSIRGYANYIGDPTWTSSLLTTNATFTVGQYGYFGMMWQLSETADYARFDLVPANTSFVPTIYGFDPSVVATLKLN